MSVIVPTVGRVVHFIPKEDMHACGFTLYAGKPHAALVTAVHGDRLVNLTVSDYCGKTFGRTSVTLRQPEDAVPQHGDYCEWMPFQMGQAQKTEQLEKALAEKK